jgi:hypothetical protein
MKQSPRERFHRLLGALDELISQEANNVADGDFEAVAAVQRRAAPVVEEIAALAPEVDNDIARARVAALLARRQHNIDLIGAQLETARSELMAVQESVSRLGRIAPAYGRAEGGARGGMSRLNATG